MNTQFIFLRPYLRGMPIIVLSMMIAVVCAKKYLSYVTPMYQSIAKIKLADIQEGTTGSNLFKDLDVFASSNKIQGEIEVIKSKEIILRTINRIDYKTRVSRIGKLKSSILYTERPFDADVLILNKELLDRNLIVQVHDSLSYTLTLPETAQSFDGLFGETLKIDEQIHLRLGLNYELIKKKSSLQLADTYHLKYLSDDQAYGEVIKNLDVVSTEKDVAVLKIIFKNEVPEIAAIFANTLAEVYIEDYIEMKYQAAKVTSDFLSKQIANVYSKLNASENKIEQFKDDKNIINLRQETETDLRKIAQLKIQQTNVKMSLEAIEELNTYIEEGKANFLDLAPNFEAFTDLLSTEMIKKIKTLQSEKTDLLLTYKSGSNEVKSVDEKISFYTTYFIESINNTKENLQVKFKNLSDDISLAEQSFIGLPQKEKMLVILEREFKLNESSYMFLNEKKIEADIAKAAKLSFHRVLTKAASAKMPVSPNRTIIVLVAAVLAMFGSILLIFIVHSLKERVSTISNIEKNSLIPVLYRTPRLRKPLQFSQHFQKQALTLDMSQVIKKKEITGVTSMKDKHGSFFHTRHLANALHTQGHSVLVLSFDYEFQSETFQVVHLNSKDFIDFSFDKIQQYICDLSKGYDYVLLKNEPLHSNFISVVLMQIVDCNLIVIDARKTLLKDLPKIDSIKEKYHVKHMHYVFNNDAYNPNIIVECWKIGKKLLRLLMKNSRNA